jgi:hypothetical protein
MKTIIEREDGTQEEHADAAPSIEVESATIFLIDKDSTVISEEFGFEEVKRVVFEP